MPYNQQRQLTRFSRNFYFHTVTLSTFIEKQFARDLQHDLRTSLTRNDAFRTRTEIETDCHMREYHPLPRMSRLCILFRKAPHKEPSRDGSEDARDNRGDIRKIDARKNEICKKRSTASSFSFSLFLYLINISGCMASTYHSRSHVRHYYRRACCPRFYIYEFAYKIGFCIRNMYMYASVLFFHKLSKSCTI